MIEALLPREARVSEVRGDIADAELFAVEEAFVARAVEKRRREFATGRTCARRALAKLGRQATAIPSGGRGEPVWPPGVVGSITHCLGYRACVVADAADLAAIGIDAEPHAALSAGLIVDIASPQERSMLAGLAAVSTGLHWDRLLFCAKEAVYKTWYPLAERPLDFGDVSVAFHPAGRFRARLLVQGPRLKGRPLRGFRGRWAVREGLALAAIGLEA